MKRILLTVALATASPALAQSAPDVVAQNADHIGMAFAWTRLGNSGHIKVVFLQGCPLAGVLRVAYPDTESQKMDAYFTALALGFELNHSPTCPALLN